MTIFNKSTLDARAIELTENISTDMQPIEFVLSAYSTRSATNDRTVAIDYVRQLPNHATQCVTPGQIVFVKELGVPLISANDRWIGLDGRVFGYTETYLLWTWGCNSTGQLGDDSIVSKTSPVTTAGGGTDWCQVSSGSAHTAAVKTDGTLWTWGCNYRGQLGDGTIVSRSSPGTTAGGITTWLQVSAGECHVAAIAIGAIFR